MSSRHVVVLAFPFGSHAGPLLNLVRKLAKAGPAVKFSFLSTAKSNDFIFSKGEDGDGCLRNIKPYNVNDGLPEGYAPSGNPLEPLELFVEAAPENFTRALEVAEAETGLKVGCIISDAFFWFAGDMADKMNVPWIPLWTAAPRSLLLHVETDAIRQALGANGSEDQTLDFLPGFSAIRRVDLPEGVMITGNSESPFAKLLHKMGHKLPQATAVAINSFQKLDPETLHLLNARFNKFLNVGPFTLTCPSPPRPDDHGCLEWLNKNQPSSVVYISFGTVITPPPHEITVLAEALEASGFPFLWSFRGSVENLFSKGFLDRTSGSIGKVVPWAPQVQILENSSVGAFVTHCGWNSISESIRGGVPMICRPFFGDQKLNMRMVEAVWKIGVQVEGGVFTKSGTINALQRILFCEGNEMKERMGVLKKHAHEAVQSNGTSTTDFNTLVGIVNQM